MKGDMLKDVHLDLRIFLFKLVKNKPSSNAWQNAQKCSTRSYFSSRPFYLLRMLLRRKHRKNFCRCSTVPEALRN
ncbi:hypothetical protein Q1695_004349 [Nippostrongylus brasiliensis]|nr:hypothetical protein Q1695_004349 [Nippostrongylus brasiliensis]